MDQQDQAITISGLLIKQLNQDNFDKLLKLFKCVFMKKKLTELITNKSKDQD